MEAVLEWMKGIVILFVVMSALMYLVPKAQYKKYIQFFLEMVLVIAVIGPISRVVYASEDFEKKIHYSEFWQEMENVQKDIGRMEFFQSDYYKKEYEAAIEMDIRQMMSGEDYGIEEIDVKLNENYELESVTMVIARASPEKSQGNTWGISDIQIEEIGEGQSLAERTILEQGALELKREVQDFYRLTDEQIFIRVKE